jgi:3-hydroxy-9,10-secoandrosta-1,3,5(10)-triene-9,17-dione monooxygenase
MMPATATDLLSRAAELRPLLQANAARGEEDRRIAEESIQALTDAGLFRITIPKRFGGDEVDIATKLQVSAAVAEGDGATGWVVALTNVCHWLVGLYHDDAQQEIFGADPDARVCGVLTPSLETRREDGGLVISGRWPWASGSLHATWGLVGALDKDAVGNVTEHVLALIPMSELTVEDTWFVAGMKATGSNTLVADELFVPDHRLLSVPKGIENEYPTEHKDEALYRSSFIPVLALILVGPQLGLARAARDLCIEKAPKRAISYTSFERQTDSVAFQLEVAKAAMKVDTAHLHAFRAAGDIDAAAARGDKLDYVTRARVRADTGYTVDTVRAAIDGFVSAHGASSFADSSAMQRIWRDANVAGRHAVVSPAVSYEVYGKALLGVENDVTVLV